MRPKELDDRDRYVRPMGVTRTLELEVTIETPRRPAFPWMPLSAGLLFVLGIILCTTGAVTWFRWIAAVLR